MQRQTDKTLEYAKKITKELSNKKWIEKNSINEKIAKGIVQNSSFKKNIANIIEKNDFSCRAAFNICKDIFNSIHDDYSEEKWLKIIYQYSLSKAFPNVVDLKINNEIKQACEIYLKILRNISEFQKCSKDNTWQSKYPLYFLTKEEINSLENPLEYNKFIKAFNNDCIYETMKLSQEVLGYNTLDHICGVHHIALNLARQLKKLNLPVDLGRVSGGAAGHDIGKYGCREWESKRVPYLHYYYTDIWFKKHDIQYIGHIAHNHSTWDLELENLPIESLLLIYSDFRVKNNAENVLKPKMHIFSLQESFEIIMNKLDNLDDAKMKRYQKVYSKLKDFEDYMLSLGVDVNNFININLSIPYENTNFSLMHGKEIIDSYKNLSIKHNINLMHLLRDEYSLNKILELARSQENWKNLRKYINAFEEYSTYLTQKQKLITLKFLYDELIHPEDDIRKQCAALIGKLIGTFDEEYRKEIPEDATLNSQSIRGYELFNKYLEMLVNPSHKIIPLHREWIGYSIITVVMSLFSNCKFNQTEGYRNVLLSFYKKYINKDDRIQLYLLEAARHIPISDGSENIHILFEYISHLIKSQNLSLRLSALEASYCIIPYLYGENKQKFTELVSQSINEIMDSISTPSEKYLLYKLSKIINLKINFKNPVAQLQEDTSQSSDIFLSNLKTATNWIVKRVQIEMQLKYALSNYKTVGLYTALHFCNILKVSAYEYVRNRAGESLIKVIPYLSPEQRNDVAIELLRALELEGYQFTEYIPKYLGIVILYLEPIELDELIDDLQEKIKQSSPELCSLLLKTIGIAIANYSKYKSFSSESEDKYNKRLIKLLGILLNGLVNYNVEVKQYAFSVIGKDIFGSSSLSSDEKVNIFKLIAKKVLTLIKDDMKDDLQLLTNAATLNHIYRFISDYTFLKGQIELPYPEKVAFFPGTFDPFSLSHKEISKSIRDLGFEVYLQIDEFSWSKQTLPNLIRRSITNMSVADELNIFLYPEDMPVNIANPEDIEKLKKSFPFSKVYLVAGSDVLLNASSYKMPDVKNSIFELSHIVFDRKNQHVSSESDIKFLSTINKIKGEVIRLSLPAKYEDISSSQIRSNIDENRDVSSLLDPLVQNFIYENGFYKREPQYKSIVKTISIEFEIIENLNDDILKILCKFFDSNIQLALKKLSELKNKESARLIIAKEAKNNKILGFSAFHWVRFSSLFHELKNSYATEYIRNNAAGRIIFIDGIFVFQNQNHESLEQIILTETLSYCLAKDYDYAVYKNILDFYNSKTIYDILESQGFLKILNDDILAPIYVVNMSNPCTLNLDAETMLKEPFKSNSLVKQTIIKARKKLQKALSSLYPGNLVLSFDINMLHENIVKRICTENNVPTQVIEPQSLGPAMCVPFGNILSRNIVPNTVTKALHTEKFFAPDMKSFTIGAYPYYLQLEDQVKVLRSFNRPVILVDDLLNKGYRMKVLDPILNKEKIKVQKIIVGILSGRGKELMDIQNREVDSAYFLPKLRHWFNESALYPFIGGDTLWRGVYPIRNLVPSINLILPYTSPSFIREASKNSIYNLSSVCIENALDILKAIEKEYQSVNERTLTLLSLGEVFVSPRCPDHGINMQYNLSLSPSNYLLNDFELLKRIENIINRQ
ncbi:cytidyltransferase [Caloramator sp. E03]|uniref:cytidyltransferase n=1 Tax=Caloramator sp. E03 TaxID=2576307 RepID=UPI001110E87F|nr:cytidyltransferase [Caloramator sp. E03]QCX32548.1 cytidyltransferase [Caloramator sp. E03]